MSRELFLGIAIPAALVLAAAAAAASTSATATLAQRLGGGARMEVRVEGVLGEGETLRRWSGVLALEAPDRARLDLPGDESMTCRREGGEWLQPALGQMLRFGPGRMAPLLDVWTLLVGASSERMNERRLGARRYLLVPRAGAVDSAWVTLGRDDLPARLETRTGDERTSMRLRDWRTAKSRGPGGFVLTPPRGVVVVPID